MTWWRWLIAVPVLLFAAILMWSEYNPIISAWFALPWSAKVEYFGQRLLAAGALLVVVCIGVAIVSWLRPSPRSSELPARWEPPE